MSDAKASHFMHSYVTLPAQACNALERTCAAWTKSATPAADSVSSSRPRWPDTGRTLGGRSGTPAQDRACGAGGRAVADTGRSMSVRGGVGLSVDRGKFDKHVARCCSSILGTGGVVAVTQPPRRPGPAPCV
jgi:hypothetical protein